MKYNMKTATFLLSATVLLFASCVSSKKYKASVAQSEELQSQVNSLNKTIGNLKEQVNTLTGQVSSLTSEKQSMDAAFTKYKAECTGTANKLRATQATLKEEYEKMEKLEGIITDALKDFEDKGLEVTMENGLVHVSMEDKLLYKSGSSKLGTEGKEALGKLVGALSDYPNLRIIVLGNTDNVKFKGATDNWTLSTERANGVVRVLRDDYKMDPKRLTAAGKGMYNPVADNSTAQGRAKNRRTEIILNPDLDKLWDSLEEK